MSTVADPTPERARLPPRELAGLAVQGLRGHRVRAALSALGVAIGIGAMVAVVGVSASSQASLLAEIDSLGTNLLTVTPGQSFGGQNEVLPSTSTAMIGHMAAVSAAAAIYPVANVGVYRTPLVPASEGGGITVDATSGDLASVLQTGTSSGRFLGVVARRFPEAVVGAAAAETLGIKRATGHLLVYIGGHWFTVVGVLEPVVLDPSLDSNVFISLPVAETTFALTPNPSEVYVRAGVNDVGHVSTLLAPTADPQNPDGVRVDRPTDALQARAAAKGQFTTLLLGLGAVALLVGAIGIANIMVISVLERRGEIGLRRALGANRRHVAMQFLAESALLALTGGAAGLAFGAAATFIYDEIKGLPFGVPTYALLTAPGAGVLIGTLAGLYPAARAARLSPTEALRS